MNNSTIAGITSFLSSVAAKAKDVEAQYDSLIFDVEAHVEVIAERLQSLGFIIIGSGVSRIVVSHPATPEVVYKLQYTRYYFQNYIEKRTYENATETQKKFLAAVLHSTDDVIVMERINGPMLRDMEIINPFVLDDIKYFDRYYCGWVPDTHSENYVYDRNDGRMVLVDYGGGCCS